MDIHKVRTFIRTIKINPLIARDKSISFMEENHSERIQNKLNPNAPWKVIELNNLHIDIVVTASCMDGKKINFRISVSK